jgi:hypothetical protein
MGANKNDLPAFDARAAVEAEKNQRGYYKTLTWQQRMIVANYLNSIEYNYPENEPPRMDKTAFCIRSRNE